MKNYQPLLKSLFGRYQKRVITKHKIPVTLAGEAKIWGYSNPIGFMELQDHVLKNSSKELDYFEKLERETIAAEYATSKELAILGGTILDNGCGIGRHIVQMLNFPASNVKKVIGVDISYDLLKKAHNNIKRYTRDVELHHASIGNLQFIQNNSVNFAIIMNRTFGNLSTEVKEKNVRETKRILTKDGNYILSLGNRKYMKLVVSHYPKSWGSPMYYNVTSGEVSYRDGIRQHYYSRNEILNYFQDREFAIKRLYEAGPNFIVWLAQK